VGVPPRGADNAVYRSRCFSSSFSGNSKNIVGIRSFVLIHLDRISDSCGFGMPVMEFRHHRKQLRTFNERNGEEKLADYKMKHNSVSIDGIEG